MIRSSPGAIPSVSTPITRAVNGSGVVPLLTVKPVPVRPAVTSLTGTAAGHGPGGAAAAWAGAGAASAPSASSTATVATATTRRPRGQKRRRELQLMIFLCGGGSAAARPLRWTWVGPSGPTRDAGQRLGYGT